MYNDLIKKNLNSWYKISRCKLLVRIEVEFLQVMDFIDNRRLFNTIKKKNSNETDVIKIYPLFWVKIVLWCHGRIKINKFCSWLLYILLSMNHFILIHSVSLNFVYQTSFLHHYTWYWQNTLCTFGVHK